MERFWRAPRGERDFACRDQFVNGAFGSDTRVAGRTRAQVFVNRDAVAGRQLAVYVWRDERIDGFTIKH
jgi:hypothetical protein